MKYSEYSMKVLPLSYMESLTDEQILEFECSDRIYVPKAEFERRMNDSEPGIATILSLTNRVGQTVVGSLFSTTYELDTIYVPYRMVQALDMDTEEITIRTIQPSLCTRVTLQPFTSDHVSAENPQELLRDAFERYTCLSVGDQVSLWIGYPVQAVIKALEPPLGEPLCFRNCEIELDLERPLDMPEEKEKEEEGPVVSENTVQHVEAVAEEPKKPEGHRLGGTEDATKTLRERMYEAAMRRLNESTQKKE
jgi:hypothetical protein